MAEAKEQLKLRETWAQIFTILKNAAPGLFGTKTFTDVTFIGSDPGDTSKMIIEFAEEDPN